MSKGRLFLIGAVLVALIVILLVFPKIIAIPVIILIGVAAYGLRKPLKRLWNLLDE